MSPPIIRASWRARATARPVPRLVATPNVGSHGSKMRSRFSGAIPGPASRTETRIPCGPRDAAETSTARPGGVNLIALATRLTTTWRSRPPSSSACRSPCAGRRTSATSADSARELVDARYGALGVINAEGTGLEDFITSG
ncbi:MAG TPA: hypothetical protein VFN39_05565, partial [Gemmatimonadaceae bacterium]|nr:hypothetical protein [Gemmatimonadaceae bacterium]